MANKIIDIVGLQAFKAKCDALYATKSDITSVLKYKGTVAAYANLPTSGNTVGDVYNVTAVYNNVPAGTNWAWNGTEWDALAGTVDLSGYALKSSVVTLTGDQYISGNKTFTGYYDFLKGLGVGTYGEDADDYDGGETYPNQENYITFAGPVAKDYIRFGVESNDVNDMYTINLPSKNGTVALTSDVTTYRGNYNSSNTYYVGDTVLYGGANNDLLYLCINADGASNNTPPYNSTCWKEYGIIRTATSTMKGLMSEHDKAKLDDIDAGAEKNSTTKLYIGTSSDTTSNAETANGATYLKLFDDNTLRNFHLIKGTGATTVSSDANGVLYINTTYSEATTSANGLMSSTDKTKLDNMSYATIGEIQALF